MTLSFRSARIADRILEASHSVASDEAVCYSVQQSQTCTSVVGTLSDPQILSMANAEHVDCIIIIRNVQSQEASKYWVRKPWWDGQPQAVALTSL